MAVVREQLAVGVIGAGAVGLGLGSCLLEAGARVHFVVRTAETASALREEGVRRTGVFGDTVCGPERLDVTTSLRDLASAAPDCVLVCTKTTAALELARRLAEVWDAFPAEPAMVLCQNGWGSAECFAARLPPRQIFCARVITGFRRVAPAAVEITAHAQPIRMGSLYGEDPARLGPLCEAIARGGIPCELSPAIAKDLFAKLLYNCALNPLAALRKVPYGPLGDDPQSREILACVVREIFDVLHGTGNETHWGSAAEYLDFFYRELLPPTRQHESSMLQDIRAGRETEIDALCGAVTLLGSTAQVPTPVNEALRTLIRAMEARTLRARTDIDGPA